MTKLQYTHRLFQLRLFWSVEVRARVREGTSHDDYCCLHSCGFLTLEGSKSGSSSSSSPSTSTSSSSSSGKVGGSKKLKKLSFLTCFVMVRTFPLDLCFCFFLTVLTVRFLLGFQWMGQPLQLLISGPSKLNGSFSLASHFMKYSLISSVSVK